jgi:hypothetical protein
MSALEALALASKLAFGIGAAAAEAKRKSDGQKIDRARLRALQLDEEMRALEARDPELAAILAERRARGEVP